MDYTVSRVPIPSSCDAQYGIPNPEMPIEIDPTVETPASGETLVLGQLYALELLGGPWQDPTHDRYDAAYSWDGVTWGQVEDLIPSAACSSMDANGLVTVYFIAEHETIYLRADDTAAAFADNMVGQTFSYRLSEAVENGSCESQFSYDALTDYVAQITVPANVTQISVTEEISTAQITTGEWYVIDVLSGSWDDNGVGPRYDLEFAFSDGYYDFSPPVWADLAQGSDLIECVTQDGNYYTAYAQASEDGLLFRVNDAALTFSDNSGSMTLVVYHASRYRPLDTCEQSYRSWELLLDDTVAANQEGGKLFGEIPNEVTPIILAPVEMQRLGWYSLTTTRGPWGYPADSLDTYAYNMQISSDGGANWDDLDTWADADCIAATDQLGHTKVYFQAPDLAGREYKLRVGDTAAWSNNVFSMGYQLHSVVNMADNPPGTCDFSALSMQDSGSIPGNASAGVQLNLPVITGPILYGITIQDTSAWQESSGGADQYGAQFSDDGGATWTPIADYPGNICQETIGNSVTIYISGQGIFDQYRLRVDSSTFSDNTGSLDYVVYENEYANPWDACFDNYDMSYLDKSYIPVKAEDGIALTLNNVYLEPGETYGLETYQGPWLPNESNPNETSYQVDISNDNGATWYPLDGFISSPVICTSLDTAGRYAQAVFNVTGNQTWKVRVSDTAGGFQDNGGNMGVRIYDASLSPGAIVPLPDLDDVCHGVCIRPESALEIGNWMKYMACYIQQYFAWCPRHTAVITGLGDSLGSREPFATFAEFSDVMASIRLEMDAYTWDDASAPDSMWTDSGSVQNQLDDNFLNTTPDSPWRGGPLINFNAATPSVAYMTTCASALEDVVSPAFQQGVCFISYQSRATGFSFWLQMLIDVLAVVIFIAAGNKFRTSVNRDMT